MRVTKPSLDAKLVAYQRAFHAILDELRDAARLESDAFLPLPLIVAAAHAAATITQYGTDLADGSD